MGRHFAGGSFGKREDKPEPTAEFSDLDEVIAFLLHIRKSGPFIHPMDSVDGNLHQTTQGGAFRQLADTDKTQCLISP